MSNKFNFILYSILILIHMDKTFLTHSSIRFGIRFIVYIYIPKSTGYGTSVFLHKTCQMKDWRDIKLVGYPAPAKSLLLDILPDPRRFVVATFSSKLLMSGLPDIRLILILISGWIPDI